MKGKIAVYGNETDAGGRLELLCRGEQLEVVSFSGLTALYESIERKRIQMILLDIPMEEQGTGSGITLIQELRGRSRLPLIVVTDQKSEEAKISALSMGADDYLAADENPLVVMAHIKSQLRRFLQLSDFCQRLDSVYSVENLRIDDIHRRVTVEGREVKLTPTEYQILKLLVKEQGKVLSITRIYEEVWKMQPANVDNTIAVHIRHIRQKIETNPKEPKYLKVIWGTGYMIG